MRIQGLRPHSYLVLLGGLTTALLAGCCALVIWLNPEPNAPGLWIETVAPAELRPGEPLRVEIDSVPFYITLAADDTIYAVKAVDPHPRGCEILWAKASKRLIEACLGSTYELDGQYVRGPAARGLESYPTRVVRGRVQINLGAPIQSPLPE